MKAYFSKKFHRVVIAYDDYSVTVLLTPSFEFWKYLYTHRIPIEKELKFGMNDAVTDWILIELPDDFDDISKEIRKYL